MAAGTALALPASPTERVEIGEIADGFTFYNRPGATLEQHNAELGECTRWMKGYGGDPDAYSQGIAFGLIWSGSIAGLAAVPIENCMIVRGW